MQVQRYRGASAEDEDEFSGALTGRFYEVETV